MSADAVEARRALAEAAGMGVPGPYDALSALPQALREGVDALLLAFADDAMLQGHRDAEWTGLGPILEEDIAFSSMAQDELGHAQVLYRLRHEHLGAPDPDAQAFLRDAAAWRNARLVELPRGDFAFALVRRALFDLAKAVQYDALRQSPVRELAVAATKLRQEKKYHLLHDRAFVTRLGRATAASHDRLQAALEAAFPAACDLFEPSDGLAALAAAKLVPGADVLRSVWLAAVCQLADDAGLNVPAADPAALGGRRGDHTEHLEPLLAAMQGMFRSDPEATW